MDVSILIVNYKLKQLTLNCLESVYHFTKGLEFEVILIDNNSCDDTPEIVRKKYPYVKVIESKENLGFGKANNLGYQCAIGKYIFLLNSDTVLMNNAVFYLFDFMESHKEAAIVGGQLYNGEMNPCISYALLFPSLRYEFNCLLRGMLTIRKRKKLNRCIERYGYAEVAYISGADMMLRRDKIEEVGMFDPDFFMYCEETNMTYRYACKGYKSYVYPKAKIQHLQGKSFNFKEVRETLLYKSRLLYLKKAGYSKIYILCCNVLRYMYLFTSIVNSYLHGDKNATYNTKKSLSLFCEISLSKH